MQIFNHPDKSTWPLLCTRPSFDYAALENVVAPILADIKTNGDVAVKKYAAQFDKVTLHQLSVNAEEIDAAAALVPEDLKAAITQAAANIRLFHEAQKEKIQYIETMPGVQCWRKSVAINDVGLYIPGGTAPLFSTLLMLGIPAQIAGCSNILLCTPSNADGQINAAVLFTAQLLGLKNIFKIGGVQAIGAMAYGTAAVPKVSKIFGPGNQYVTAAKQMVSRQGTAIDMPAGPSELAVYADETAIPAFVAADLLSQAEHGVDSQVMLVASSEKMLLDIQEQVQLQLVNLPRKDIAEAALTHSRYVILSTTKLAFDFLNTYAPEHLIIASDAALPLSELVQNAGSIFLGNYSPESAGDYATGTNHTLPTNGYAKAYSGVSVDSFVKKITFQQLTQAGLEGIADTVELMAAAEGLEAHRHAVAIRRKF